MSEIDQIRNKKLDAIVTALAGIVTSLPLSLTNIANIGDQTLLGNDSGASDHPSALTMPTLWTMLVGYAAATKTSAFTIDNTAIIRPVNASTAGFSVTMPRALKGLYVVPKLGTDANIVEIYDDVTPTPNLLCQITQGGFAMAFAWSNGTTASAIGFG